MVVDNGLDGNNDGPHEVGDSDKLEVFEVVVDIGLDFSKDDPHDCRNSDTLGMCFDWLVEVVVDNELDEPHDFCGSDTLELYLCLGCVSQALVNKELEGSNAESRNFRDLYTL